MGFFPPSPEGVEGAATFGRNGCKTCPLAKLPNASPDMPARGSIAPGGAYFLGSSPSAIDDASNRPFVGPDSDLLTSAIRESSYDYATPISTRFNNVVRTRTTNDRAPTSVEIEHCRPSIVDDIGRTQPAGIIGMGAVPLNWATGLSGISLWRGRRIPITIDSHRCYYYPITHPAFVMRNGGASGIEGSFFKRDLKFAMAAIASGDDPPPEFDITDFEKGFTPVKADDAGFARLAEVLDAPSVAFDLETYSPDKTRDTFRAFGEGARVISMAFASERGTVALMFDPKDGERITQAISEPNKIENLIAHNLAFDLEWLLELVVPAGAHDGFMRRNRRRLRCSMAQGYVLDNREGALKLDLLCYQELGVKMKSLTQPALDLGNMHLANPQRVLRYNALDAYFTLRLFDKLSKRLDATGLTAVANEQQRRIPTLAAATSIGLPIDIEENRRLGEEQRAKLAAATQTIKSIPLVVAWEQERGMQFDHTVEDHVRSILSPLGELPTTDKGNVSVSEPALSSIGHPLGRAIIEYRQAKTLLSTFINSMAPDGKNHWLDGRIHPKFNACRTRTRRLSSSSPNGQNWPKRKDEGVRNQIVAPPTKTILSADFGQIEARVMAADSQDETFVRAIMEGYDIHRDWADRIFARYPDWTITDPKEQRNAAKGGMVFASFYLATARTVAEACKIPLEIAEELLREFWQVFDGVKRWQLALIEQYKQRGYLELCTGFRCRGAFTQFQIVNYRVQGSASDIVVGAMDRLSEHEIQAVLNVHDDLIFFLGEGRWKEDAKEIAAEMIIAPDWMRGVPLTVELSEGKRWGDMKEVKLEDL